MSELGTKEENEEYDGRIDVSMLLIRVLPSSNRTMSVNIMSRSLSPAREAPPAPRTRAHLLLSLDRVPAPTLVRGMSMPNQSVLSPTSRLERERERGRKENRT